MSQVYDKLHSKNYKSTSPQRVLGDVQVRDDRPDWCPALPRVYHKITRGAPASAGQRAAVMRVCAGVLDGVCGTVGLWLGGDVTTMTSVYVVSDVVSGGLQAEPMRVHGFCCCCMANRLADRLQNIRSSGNPHMRCSLHPANTPCRVPAST
jgi:hypothetical protein